MSDDVTMNVKGLDQIVKALKATPPMTRVGILGSKIHFTELKPGQSQPKTPMTNAEIGAAHEFGTSTIPQRSFLRIPISENLEKGMRISGLLTKEVLAEVIKQGSITPWMQKVAIVAENCVSDAFDTGGDGKWPAWKNPNYSNNAGQLLVDTTQLRNSITSEVK